MGNWSSFGDFAVTLARAAGGQGDPRLTKLRASGMNENMASEGGFAVPEELETILLERVYAESLAGFCNEVPVASSAYQQAFVDETSRADGSRFGGVTGEWLAEGAAATPSTPKVGQIKTRASKLVVSAWGTGELESDATAYGAMLGRVLLAEAAFKLSDAIVNGDGVGKPLGVLQSSAKITVSKEAGQASQTITGKNIVEMWKRLWGPSRRRAVWLCNEATDGELVETFVRQPNDAGSDAVGGHPLYVPATSDSDTPRMIGRPVIVTEQCPALGQEGDLILVDLGSYVLANRGLRIRASDQVSEAAFASDQILFRLTHRIDGQMEWKTPVTPKSGGATLSPIITLEER